MHKILFYCFVIRFHAFIHFGVRASLLLAVSLKCSLWNILWYGLCWEYYFNEWLIGFHTIPGHYLLFAMTNLKGVIWVP